MRCSLKMLPPFMTQCEAKSRAKSRDHLFRPSLHTTFKGFRVPAVLERSAVAVPMLVSPTRPPCFGVLGVSWK